MASGIVCDYCGRDVVAGSALQESVGVECNYFLCGFSEYSTGPRHSA